MSVFFRAWCWCVGHDYYLIGSFSCAIRRIDAPHGGVDGLCGRCNKRVVLKL